MLELINQEIRMDSREIAELTGKRHDHVIRDIENMLDGLQLGRPSFGASYQSEQGKEVKCYRLPYRETMILISGYSIELRAKIVDRWMELEAEKKKEIPDFSNPAEAARAWADAYEQKQLAEEKTKSLQIELDQEKSWYSVKRVQAMGYLKDMNSRKVWGPLKKWCIANNQQIREIFDANYGTVKTYHASAWEAVYGIDFTKALIGEST